MNYDLEIVPIEMIKRQAGAIQDLLKLVLVEGEHYGKIPGCKNSILYKNGAEKIAQLFRLRPEYEIKILDLPNGHREYQIKCRLLSIVTGNICGEGDAICSTMESKYRYRNAERACPECGAVAIITSKNYTTKVPEGYVCFKGKGGCGVKYDFGDASIEDQKLGKIDNVDIADQYNTCIKMAQKRAQVAAVLTATAAGDIFSEAIPGADAVDPAIPPVVPPATPGNTSGGNKKASEAQIKLILSKYKDTAGQMMKDIVSEKDYPLAQWTSAEASGAINRYLDAVAALSAAGDPAGGEQ